MRKGPHIVGYISALRWSVMVPVFIVKNPETVCWSARTARFFHEIFPQDFAAHQFQQNVRGSGSLQARSWYAVRGAVALLSNHCTRKAQAKNSGLRASKLGSCRRSCTLRFDVYPTSNIAPFGTMHGRDFVLALHKCQRAMCTVFPPGDGFSPDFFPSLSSYIDLTRI